MVEVLNSDKVNSLGEQATSLPVMEHFYTLQGEGVHTGRAAYFVRLGGCDVGCVWCDVKDSWEAGKHPLWKIEDLIGKIKETPSQIVVITGGEPLMHNLTPLTSALHRAGLRTHIETSGSSPLSGELDWITLSPKKFKVPLPEVLPEADELKIVVFNSSDFAWAEKWALQVSSHCKLFLQPEWSKAESITPLIVDYIKEHPQWQLSLQTHKYINVP
ncbi:MAG TPA: 7-carboxy-7-deazaguanine synthase QueE [Flavisolibacter sp.]|nr:7-carboxy-7-deazaguanine synthase QueE [Flavisolibacter sp.]